MEKRKKILAVDDQEEILTLVKWAMENFLGCAVSCAENGREAMKLLGRESYDLIITDINMPIMNGYELVENTRTKLGVDCPIVILSSEINELPDMERLNVLLAKKPFEMTEFVKRAGFLLDSN